MVGWVRNDSEETWSAVNIHPFVSTTPITSREELAAAATSDPSQEVGTRLLAPGQFVNVGDLTPGQSAPFRISLRVADLPITGEPGVYWIGVHALGANSQGRDNLADGRARTFIPLVTGSPRPTTVSVVVPIREKVRRDKTGRLLDPTAWSQTLADPGRLERLATFLDSAPAFTATILLDPAVLEAVASVAADNPPLSLGAGTEPQPSPSPSDTPQPADSSSNGASRAGDRLGPADRTNAARWLAQMNRASERTSVLGLGYADPDTSALARRRPRLLDLAAKVAATTFTRLSIQTVPAVAPPDGWLDDAALPRIPKGTMILVSDHAAPRTRTRWRTPDGQDLVFTDQQAGSGGPGPTARLDPLALRQRIVSDAALRLGEHSAGPMVVELPADWDPGATWQAADFFSGMELPWLDLVPLGSASDPSTPTFDAALGYPAAARHDELGAKAVRAASALTTTATVLDQLLRTDNDVAHTIIGEALSGVSYHARRDRAVAHETVLAANSALRARLDKVSVTGTDFVTLSGGSGTLAVTLVNDLDQPITVGIASTTDSPGVHIQTPDPLEMAPGQRTVLRLHASASTIGVHQVTLSPVTSTGARLGTPLIFSLRTSEVGRLIWFVLGGGGSCSS